MQKTQKKHNNIRKEMVLLGVLILAAFIIVLNPKLWSGSGVVNKLGTVDHVENHLVLRDDENNILGTEIDRYSFFRLEKGKTYTLSAIMTYDATRDAVPYGFIHLDHIYCRITLNGEELFRYMPEDDERWDYSRSAGFLYKAFPVPRDCEGKELKIELLPMLSSVIEYGMPDLSFGDLTSMIFKCALRDVIGNVMVLLCLLMGIASIVFAIIVLKGSNYRESISIGVFSMLFAVYFTTECKLNNYFIGNPYYIYLMNYLSFCLLPVSIMGFMRERLPSKYKNICIGFIAAELGIFAVQCVLHFGGICDFREMVTVNHLICAVESAFVLILIWKIEDRKKRKHIFLQILPIVLGFTLDILIYRSHWAINVNDATFTIVGVVIFLITELIRVCRTSVSAYVNSARSKMYQKMAYSDVLTEVGNRRAYDEEILRIEKSEDSFESVIIVAADLNWLKYVNDNFGHSAGDKLIHCAAQIMVEVIGDRGRVFRTGGDEFAAFLYDVTMDQTLKLVEQAKKLKQKFNEENEFTMSVAVGISEVRDGNVMEAVKEADRKMYEDKARQKAVRE